MVESKDVCWSLPSHQLLPQESQATSKKAKDAHPIPLTCVGPFRKERNGQASSAQRLERSEEEEMGKRQGLK